MKLRRSKPLLTSLGLILLTLLVSLWAPGVRAQSFVLAFPDLLPGATDVPSTRPVVFTFDMPMQTRGVVAWSANVDATKVAYSWSADATALTCVYAPGWPVNAIITWELDPGQFVGVDGSQLLMPSSDTFQISSDGPCGTSSSGQGTFTVSKALQYVQASAASPAPSSTVAGALSAILTAPAANRVSSAFLKSPDDSSREMLGYLAQSFVFSGNPAYGSQAALDAAYPDGTYEFDWQLDNGIQGSAKFSLPAGGYPPTPQILNFNQAQAVNPGADFVLQYAAFTGATGDDVVNFTLSDDSGTVFQDPDPCVPRTLSPTATSLTIPAGTLATNKVYQATLSFTHVTGRDTTSLAGAVGTASLSKTLQFTIGTSSSGAPSVTAPQFTLFERLPDGSFQLQLTGQPNASYQIDSSTDLQTWNPLITSNSASGVFSFTDRSARGQSFYRAETAGH